MTYKEYKSNIRKSIVEKGTKIIKSIDRLRDDINVILLGEFSIEDLHKMNIKYNLGLKDINPCTVLVALNKLLKAVEHDFDSKDIDLKALDNDFKTGVSNIPFLIITLLIVSSMEDIYFIEKIFRKVILAEKDFDRNIISYEDEDFSELTKYEDKLKELLEKGMETEFRKLAIAYFDYFLSKDTVQENIINHDVPITHIKAWIAGMLNIKDFQRIRMPICFYKMMKNTIRVFKKEIKASLKGYVDLYNEVLFSYYDDVIIRQHIINKLRNNFGITSVSADMDKPTVLVQIQDVIDFINDESNKFVSLEEALTDEGFKSPVFSLPNLVVAYNYGEANDIYFAYLIVTGLKYNGSVRRKVKDDVERVLLSFEIRLAPLINNDFTIDLENKSKFLDIYELYLTSYLSGNCSKEEMDRIIALAKDNMSYYIDNAKNLINNSSKNEKVKEVEKTEVEMPRAKENPYQSYLNNFKDNNIGSFEEFEVLLNESTLTVLEKNNYLEQMMILQDEKKQEELRARINNIWDTYFTREDARLYYKARKSVNAEIFDISREIDAIIDLLLIAESQEDREELFDSADELFLLLRDKLSFNYKANETIEEKTGTKFIYFKDSDEEPYLFKAIKRTQKGEYKMILNSFNRILEGNTDNDMEFVRKDLPVRVFYRGRKFKIFYTVIGNYVVFIDGDNDKIEATLKSKAFLKFLKDNEIGFKDNSILDDNSSTLMILEELQSSRGRK